jgi:hydrogenase maturation protease
MTDRQDAPRVLVAGIGNVFLGDDGFGVEVIGRLDRTAIPETVDVVDYGIRGVHLAYELLARPYGVLILVDAVPTGQAPGTVSVLEVAQEEIVDEPLPADAFHGPVVDGHGMTPQAVLNLLRTLGGQIGRVLVVGCEPESVEERMGLAPPVEAAVERAADLVAQVAREEAARLAEPADLAGGM